MGRIGFRHLTVATFFSVLSAVPAWASDDLSGPWVSSRNTTDVYAADWGPSCGPLPAFAPLALPARLDLRDEGGTLALEGEGLKTSTARCPAPMTDVSSRRDGGAWTLECADGAVHHEIVYAAVEPTRLEVRHRATLVGAGSCRAVAVLSASYSRESGPALARRAPDDPRCTAASVPAKVEVRPSAAALRAGGAICFAAEAYDADGCPASPAASFSLAGAAGAALGTIEADGCFRAATELAGPASLVVLARGEHATGVALVDLVPPAGKTAAGAAAGGAGAEGAAGAGPVGTGTGASGAAAGTDVAGAPDGEEPDGGPSAHGRADISTIIGAALAVGVTGALAVLLGHFITLWSRRRQALPSRGGRARGPATRTQPPPGRPAAPARPAQAPAGAAWAPGTPGAPATPASAGANQPAYLGDAGRPAARSLPSQQPPAGTALPSPATLVLMPRSESPEVLVCPACRHEYEDGARFCTADGSTLVTQAVASSTVQGGICPRCHRGTEAGTRHCPHDGEEVMPYALYQTTRGDGPSDGRKICPSCNARYEGEATFCGRDGAELVLLN